MRFKIQEVDTAWDLFELNPSLAPYRSEFEDMTGASPGMSLKRMFVYLAYLVDKESPLKNIQSLRDRQKEAAELAKLVKRPGGIPEWVQEIIQGSDYVNRCKIRMLYVQNNNDWALLNTLQNSYYKTLELIENGQHDKTKDAIKLKNEIDGLQDRINGGEMSDAEREMVFAILQEESLGIRPEEHIKAFQQNKSVFSEIGE
jgi:hypothetical protein